MSGYLTQESVSEITRKELGLNYPTAHYYTCGPQPMMDIVVEGLKSIWRKRRQYSHRVLHSYTKESNHRRRASYRKSGSFGKNNTS